MAEEVGVMDEKDGVVAVEDEQDTVVGGAGEEDAVEGSASKEYAEVGGNVAGDVEDEEAVAVLVTVVKDVVLEPGSWRSFGGFRFFILAL